MMSALLSLAALAAPLFQGPQPGPAGTAAAGAWQPLNRLVLAVNDDGLTEREIRGRASLRRPTSEEEQRRANGEVLAQRTRDFLMVQAGHDLGFEKERVKALVKSELASRQERAGTVMQLADALEEADIDAPAYVGQAEARIYSQLWQGSVVGRYAGPGGRPYVDRFIRPGRVLFEFDSRSEKPVHVGLQLMQFKLDGPESAARSRSLAEEALERVHAGEDFGALAEELKLCKPGTAGIEKPQPLADLEQLYPEWAGFLASAAPGDVSPVLPARRNGEITYLVVIKLLERKGGEVTSFLDRDIQESIRKELQSQLDRLREGQALDELLNAAYLWPDDVFSALRR